MTATVQPAAGIAAWRIAVIAVVGALAVGIGVAAGTFLLRADEPVAGAAADYVPGDAPFYLEWRLDPSAEQDAALRELLGRFPAIDGLDLERPLYDQLGELIDESLAEHEEIDLSWTEDVDPWFDGSIAVAVTELDVTAMAAPADPAAEMPTPGILFVAGVTDAEAARAFADDMRAEAEAQGMTLTASEHLGVTIYAADGSEGAYAVADDAILAGADAETIVEALDRAAGAGGDAAAAEMAAFVERLPSDWIGFARYDMTELLAAGLSEAEGADPSSAAAMRSLLENQPMRGAMAFTAGGDRFAVDTVSSAPTGPFAVENADRGLASEVPGDALYFSEGGNIGEALSAVIVSIKDAASTAPEAAEQISMIEAALGAGLEELGAWIDDGALVAGWDGAEPYAGMVLVPNDIEAARRRLAQLATFAGLAALDASSGISVEEGQVAGADVTTIRWQDPNAAPDAEVMPPGIPTGLAIQFTVTDDRAVIGIGERFVGRVLELDASASLGAQARFTDAIAELGGAENAGVTWMDVRGTREAIEAAVGPMIGMFDTEGVYERDIVPWLVPFDRAVSVTVLDGDFLVQRAALLVE